MKPIFRTIATVALAGIAQAATAATESSVRFDVYLDDKPIGSHRYDFERSADGLRLRSSADFEVKFLFFTAFDYEHRNTEIWRDGCVAGIDATTRSNGRTFVVDADTVDDTLRVETGDTRTTLDGCIATFAYWDRAVLARDRLLNTQTGEWLDVTFERIEPGTVRVDGSEIAVDRYRLRAKDTDITLAYDAASGAWVALDTVVRGGRQLRYRLADRAGRDPSRLALGKNGAQTPARP